jgi:uncharacterized protein (TIGR02145 family)
MNRVWLWSAALLLVTAGCHKTSGPGFELPPLLVTDIDSNVYHTVTIGNQAWLKENLRTTRFRNGDSIPLKTVAAEWSGTLTSACCNYDNLPGTDTVYGKLYNGRAVSDPRGICPTGWHVPDQAEWNILTSYLGGENVSGLKLKEPGFVHWTDSSLAATNETGFTALPGGYRNEQGQFGNRHFKAIFWSSSKQDTSHGWYWYLYYNYNGIYKDHYHDIQHGFSVRCIYDKPIAMPDE